MIVGLCMLSIPEGETRRIDGIATFCITSTFSVMGEMQFLTQNAVSGPFHGLG